MSQPKLKSNHPSSRRQTWAPLIRLVVVLMLGYCQPSLAEDRVLLVGVGDYANISGLPGINLDIATMQQVALKMGFKPPQIKVLFNAEATYANVKQAFERWLVNGVSANDRVLFYFSGHGTQVPDNNADETDNSDEALIMYDVKMVNKRLTNVLIDDEFAALLQNIPSQNTLVLVDACHSGTATKSLAGNISLGESQAYSKFYRYEGMYANATSKNIVASARQTHDVADDRTGHQPAMDHHVLISAAKDNEEALATKRGSIFTLGLDHVITEHANNTAILTPRVLAQKVETYVLKKIRSNRMNGLHHPQLSGNPRLHNKPLRFVSAKTAGKPLWMRLQKLTENVKSMRFQAGQTSYRLGEHITFTLNIPENGYLNVINIGPDDVATVLFPNKYHSNNKVAPGIITLPTAKMGFALPATAPPGETLTVAFLTATKIDAYQAAVDGRGKNGQMQAVLTQLSQYGLHQISKAATRNIGVVATQPNKSSGFIAAKVLVTIK